MPPRRQAKKAMNAKDKANPAQQFIEENSVQTGDPNSQTTVGAAMASLTAQAEREMNLEFNEITRQIIEGGLEASAVTNVQKKTMVNLMKKQPKVFQKSMLRFIDCLITLDAEDAYIRNFHRLLGSVYQDFMNPRHGTNGVLMVKSILRHLLDTFNLPKLLGKIQLRCAVLMSQVVHVSESIAKKLAEDAQKRKSVEAKVSGTPPSMKSMMSEPSFYLLDNDSRPDQELKALLTETCLQMLQLSTPTTIQGCGVQIGSLMSDFKSDQIFAQLMKLLSSSKTIEIRKRIIRSMKTPYSAAQLAFIGKRLRDINPEVCLLIFKQLTASGTQISAFPTAEARMLVLTEGLTSSNEGVWLACIEFLTPTVLANQDNLVVLFQLIDAKLTFENQYFSRVPVLLILALLKILPDEVTLVNYLRDKVMKKLDTMVQGSNSTDQNVEMKSEGSPQKVRFGDEPPAPELITFEELLMLRLTYEINTQTKDKRVPEYLEVLDDIVPDFEDYKAILNTLACMPEPNLPSALSLNGTSSKKSPYPEKQTGFSRRAILGEWVKFALQMNIKDEVTRTNLVSLVFQMITQIHHSYSDYEHVLRPRKQLLNQDALTNDDYDKYEEEADDAEDQEDHFLNGNAQIEITIRTFQELGTGRSLQEYCKPWALETLTLDFDDVCKVAVCVGRRLMGSRIDDFQLSMVQAISDLMEPLEEMQKRDQEQNQFMSQAGHPDQTTFSTLKKKFEGKLEEKADEIQELVGADEDFEVAQFNKVFTKFQRYVDLMEEINLKEKLCFKRALIMCHSLLKQCRITDVDDSNVISICETLIEPAIKSVDHENTLLAIECIGLLTLLDSDVFSNYTAIFVKILTEDVNMDNKREKVIALKSSVDGLIVHGVTEETVELYELITQEYLRVKDRVLRQVAVEGVCKMLFSTKLCDENDQGQIEAVLANLLMQLFDKKFNHQNSLVRSILTVFFQNFILFSQTRCEMMLNALTKVVYSILRSKYDLASNQQPKKGHGKAKGKKKVGGKQRKAPSRSYSSASHESESEFSGNENIYISDDSGCVANTATMQQICASLDTTQIIQVCLTLMLRTYINENAVFKLTHEISVLFFTRLLRLNSDSFQKVQIMKDVITPILDNIRVENSDDLDRLRELKLLWEANLKMLVNQTLKVGKFTERLNHRIMQLEEILEEANGDEGVTPGMPPAGDAVMNEGRQVQIGFEFVDTNLDDFWVENIQDTFVDRVKDDDRELLQIQQVWQVVSGQGPSPHKSALKKKNFRSPQPFKEPTTAGNRRQGRRNRQAPAVAKSAVQSTNRALPSIQEEMGSSENRLSSSEKQKNRFSNKVRICDTIQEISEDKTSELSEEEPSEQDSAALAQEEREPLQRKVMHKVSKRMAREFSKSRNSSAQRNSISLNSKSKWNFQEGQNVLLLSKNPAINKVRPQSESNLSMTDSQKMLFSPSVNSSQSKLQSSPFNAISLNFAAKGSGRKRTINYVESSISLADSSAFNDNDDDESETISKDGKAASSKSSSRMRTRARNKSASSQNQPSSFASGNEEKSGSVKPPKRSRGDSNLSMDSEVEKSEEESSSDDGMFDFIEGKLSKQLKKQQKKQKTAKSNDSNLSSNASAPKIPTRSRKRRVVVQ